MTVGRIVAVGPAQPDNDTLCAVCRKRPDEEGANPLYRVETGWREPQDKRGQTSVLVLCEYDLFTLHLRIEDAIAAHRGLT